MATNEIMNEVKVLRSFYTDKQSKLTESTYGVISSQRVSNTIRVLDENYYDAHGEAESEYVSKRASERIWEGTMIGLKHDKKYMMNFKYFTFYNFKFTSYF